MNPQQRRQHNLRLLLQYHIKELQDSDYEQQIRIIQNVIRCNRATAKDYRNTIEPWLNNTHTHAPTLITVQDDSIEQYILDNNEENTTT